MKTHVTRSVIRSVTITFVNQRLFRNVSRPVVGWSALKENDLGREKLLPLSSLLTISSCIKHCCIVLPRYGTDHKAVERVGARQEHFDVCRLNLVDSTRWAHYQINLLCFLCIFFLCVLHYSSRCKLICCDPSKLLRCVIVRLVIRGGCMGRVNGDFQLKRTEKLGDTCRRARHFASKLVKNRPLGSKMTSFRFTLLVLTLL